MKRRKEEQEQIKKLIIMKKSFVNYEINDIYIHGMIFFTLINYN